MPHTIRRCAPPQVLGSPGSGKSSLLQCIAGKLPSRHTSGRVLYNGQTASRVDGHLSDLAKYVEQEERHLPLLTVKETLQYAEAFQSEVRRDFTSPCGRVCCSSVVCG